MSTPTVPPPPTVSLPPAAARPNPFAFASDTVFRFVILVAVALGVTLFVWSWAWLNVGDNARTMSDRMGECLPLLDAQPRAGDGVAPRSFDDCMRPVYRRQALAGLAGAALLTGTTLVTYWFLPTWRRRRRRLVPASAAGVPAVAGAVEAARRSAAVGDRLEVLIDPLDPRVSGVAFGRVGRRSLELHRGLVARLDDDPAAFRAVVLHELAHLRNRDIDVTYLTVAAWRCFTVVTLVPLAVTFARQGAAFALHAGGRMLALVLVVYLARNSVLRARESFADVRAAGWPGGEALDRVLARPSARPAGWRRLLALHPTPAARRAALKDPSGLLRLGLWEAGAAGVATTVAFATVLTGLNGLRGTTPVNIWLSGLVYVPLAVWIVGLGTWRSALADAVTGRRTAVTRAALGLGCGFVAGLLLAPEGAVEAATAASWTAPAPHVWLLWSGVVIGAAALQVAWIASSARAWMGVTLTRPSPRPVVVTGMTLASLMTAGWLPLVLTLHDYASFEPEAGVSAMTFLQFGAAYVGFGTAPLLLLALLTAVWAYPLLGATRRPGPVVGSWVSLDPVEPRWRPATPDTRLRAASLAGVSAGLLLLAAPFALVALALAAVPVEVRGTDVWVLQFFGWAVTVAVLGQVAAAVVAAARTPALRVAHGLLAATLAGTLGAMGILAADTAARCIPGWSLVPGRTCVVRPEFAWEVLHTVLRAGGVAGLLAALVVAAVAAVAGRSPQRTGTPAMRRPVAVSPGGAGGGRSGSR